MRHGRNDAHRVRRPHGCRHHRDVLHHVERARHDGTHTHVRAHDGAEDVRAAAGETSDGETALSDAAP